MNKSIHKTSPDAPITLTILRGPHDLVIADYVVPYIGEGAILFIEHPGTRQQQASFNNWANTVTLQKRPGQSTTASESDFTVQENNGYTKLIRRLKDTNVLVRAVDETYEQPRQIDYFANLFSVVDFPIAWLEKANLSAIYSSIDDKVGAVAQSVHARNEIVAEQVTETLRKIHADSPERPLRAALVQGYLHRSKAAIKKLMPQIKIEEHIYNPVAMKFTQHEPLFQILQAKIDRPDKPVPQALFDRALLVYLKDPMFTTNGIDAANFELPLTVKTEDSRQAKPSLQQAIAEEEQLNDEQVQQQLLVLLETYRLKGAEKYFVPPIRLIRQSGNRLSAKVRRRKH